MSDLITNLNSIYTTKLQIKEVIGTDSDVFSEYPQLISEAIEEGGGSGYAYITVNGDHDIHSYAYVNVEVPIPEGYVFPQGSYSITDNGTFDVTYNASAVVNVPASAVTSGTYNIIEE